MQSNRGFTLLELSVVIVILGLLVGGVIAGRSIIRASEMRSISIDLVRYQTAVNAFKTKYDGLPGDLEDATTYWGAADAVPATCITTNSGGPATCNGNGNGHITDLIGVAPWVTEAYEAFRAWQQLSNAGFIQGKYTGVTPGPYRTSVIGTNVPASKIKGTGFSLTYVGTYSNPNWFSDSYGHVLLYGAQMTDWDTTGRTLNPDDMKTIDMKMDDGRPLYGIIMTFIGTGCTTSSVVTADYAVSDRRPLCNVIYKLGF